MNNKLKNAYFKMCCFEKSYFILKNALSQKDVEISRKSREKIINEITLIKHFWQSNILIGFNKQYSAQLSLCSAWLSLSIDIE